MSKVKKILAVVLSMAMILGMSMTSFAADSVVGNSDDTGNITVKGITPEDGITVTAYSIAPATYDSNGSFSGYANPYGIDDLENPTQEEISDIAARTDLTPAFTLTKSGNDYVATDKAVGMYLISITGAETKVYNTAIASIQYKNVNGTNAIDAGSVDLVSNANLWVKVSGTPSVTKTEETTGVGNTATGASANIGDTVSYTVSVNPVPNYGGNYPALNVVDTLSAGLDYTADSLAVTIGDTTLDEDTDYTLTVEGQTITVNFVVNGTYTLNSYAGQEAVITYDAVVNENAALNAAGNSNDVILNYTTDSKTAGNDGTDRGKTYTYTFDIDGTATGTTGIVTKVGEDEDVDALEGAVFGLYTNAAATELYTNTNMPGKVDVDGEAVTGSAVSDADGQLHMTGLAAGTYYLKELSAPDGYSVNTNIFEVVITAAYAQDGKLASWNVTIDGEETASFAVNNTGETPVETSTIGGIDIANTKLSSLPSTGGIGTTIFTIGGIVIMVAAAFLFFRSRKKSN